MAMVIMMTIIPWPLQPAVIGQHQCLQRGLHAVELDHAGPDLAVGRLPGLGREPHRSSVDVVK